MSIDITHYLSNNKFPPDITEPARRLATYMGRIISAASLIRPGSEYLSAIPCRRRPERKPCIGRLVIWREENEEINWQCPFCGTYGVIRNWYGCPWDLRNLHKERASKTAGNQNSVYLSDKEYDLLCSIEPIYTEAAIILEGVIVDDVDIIIYGIKEELQHLIEIIVIDAEHASQKLKQIALESIISKIEKAIT